MTSLTAIYHSLASCQLLLRSISIIIIITVTMTMTIIIIIIIILDFHTRKYSNCTVMKQYELRAL